VRYGEVSLAAGSLLFALLPWWIRIAAGKLRLWTELADEGSRQNLYTAYATSLFFQIAAMFLFWQSCIIVRGIHGTYRAPRKVIPVGSPVGGTPHALTMFSLILLLVATTSMV